MAQDKGSGDYINVAELATNLWAARKLICGMVAATLLLTVLYLHVATYTYTIQTEVFPVQQADSAASLSKLAGLASLAGVNVGSGAGQPPNPFQLYTAEIYSRDLANALATNQSLMTIIFASDWDKEAGRWRERGGAVHFVGKIVKSILGFPLAAWHPPDGASLQDFIKDEVVIEESPTNPTVKIVFHHKDANFGVRFLTALHEAVDQKLRQRQLHQSNEYIQYLNRLLPTISVAEYRVAIASILTEQEKLRMVASSDTPYSAQTLGAAFASAKPTKPNPTLFLIGAFFVSLLFAMAYVSFTTSVPFIRRIQTGLTPDRKMRPAKQGVSAAGRVKEVS